ncbi:YqaI family protein [Bacillus sp. DTU_2020_1000418_1_SI_GHA_SEK_038]|uniref:YqaI family protein n=1 Tax=Bacillus sp. DTU_2020_1000418_1_SI_GHA_SEK_038 TaxID=3077585 RepID=UPI0039779CE7
MLEHPMISRIERTGYPNMMNQPEHAGIDFFGDEILAGDEYCEFDGELILKDNLERYLSEELEFTFKTAE